MCWRKQKNCALTIDLTPLAQVVKQPIFSTSLLAFRKEKPMYTALRLTNLKANCTRLLRVVSRCAYLLLFLNIKTQAITKMHQPDLFFGVNALAIEESGISNG